MPNGTAQTATSRMAHGGAPRRRRRDSATSAATTIPRTMQRAYALIGSGPSCHTAVLGLGIAAIVTGAHATAAEVRARSPPTQANLPCGGTEGLLSFCASAGWVWAGGPAG